MGNTASVAAQDVRVVDYLGSQQDINDEAQAHAHPQTSNFTQDLAQQTRSPSYPATTLPTPNSLPSLSPLSSQDQSVRLDDRSSISQPDSLFEGFSEDDMESLQSEADTGSSWEVEMYHEGQDSDNEEEDAEWTSNPEHSDAEIENSVDAVDRHDGISIEQGSDRSDQLEQTQGSQESIIDVLRPANDAAELRDSPIDAGVGMTARSDNAPQERPNVMRHTNRVAGGEEPDEAEYDRFVSQESSADSHASDGTSLLPSPRKDLVRIIRSHRDWHCTVEQYQNRGCIAGHRYLIAVVPEGKARASIRGHADVVWFCGYNKTTILTIFNKFARQAATESFYLCLGRWQIEKDVCIEELDHFDDKLVVLRCVSLQSPKTQSVGVSHAYETMASERSVEQAAPIAREEPVVLSD